MGSSTRRVVMICLFTSLGCFLFGLDMGYMGPIIADGKFKRDVPHVADWEDPHSKIDPAQAGFIVSIFAVGSMITALPLVSGYLLDHLGRKVSLIIGCVVFMLGCLTQVVASSVAVMVAGRFVAGCSIGILSTAVPLYQSELAPPHLRGVLGAISQGMIGFGVLVGVFTDMLVLPWENGWRWGVALPIVPCIVLFAGLFFCPRSPRWLVQRGRREAALAVLRRIRDEEADAEAELEEIVAEVEAIRASGRARWRDLCSGSVPRLLAVGVALQALQQLTGCQTFLSFGPAIFVSLGLDPALWQTRLAVLWFLGTVPAMIAIEYCGRRPLLLWGAVGMLLPTCTMGVLGSMYTDVEEGQIHLHNEVAGKVIVACVFLFGFCFSCGWGATTWIYCAEIFPLKVRGRCLGLTTMAEWLGVFFVNQMTPILLNSVGFYLFFILGGFCLAAALLSHWLPETKGIQLERMDQVWLDRFGKPSKNVDLSSSSCSSSSEDDSSDTAADG